MCLKKKKKSGENKSGTGLLAFGYYFISHLRKPFFLAIYVQFHSKDTYQNKKKSTVLDKKGSLILFLYHKRTSGISGHISQIPWFAV